MKNFKLLKLPKIAVQLFIAFVVISLIVGLGSAFNGNSVSKQKVSKTDFSVKKEIVEKENKVIETQQEIVEDITKETKESDKLSTEIVDTKKVNQPKESPKQNTEIQKKATSAKAEEVKGDDEVKENKQEEQKEETIVVIPKKIEIWDELGITEDEYYNAPMWKWATVDFSIEKYGSQEASFKACIEYGDSTGMGYSCSIINSYSGRYLGEMIELF